MKRGKKPGEMQAARRRHLARQARQDAITKLKLGEIVTMSALTHTGYQNVRVKPMNLPVPEGMKLTGDTVLLMEGKIQVRPLGFKDDCYVIDGFYVREDQLFGMVIEDLQTIPGSV